MATTIGIAETSLKGQPACTLLMKRGAYEKGSTVASASFGNLPKVSPRPVIRAALVDENGTFVPRMTEYAVVEMDERVVREVGGEAGVALLRATARCTTTLYLLCGGSVRGMTKVISSKSSKQLRQKYTDFLPQEGMPGGDPEW